MTAPALTTGRRALLLGATALAGCGGLPQGSAPAQAQTAPDPGPAPGNSIRPVAAPCADGPGDILGLTLDGAGSPQGTVLVFGQAFRAGDLPRGSHLAVRMADNGRPLRTQLDITTRHGDGSARFGVVSVELAAALPRGDRMGIVLAAAPGPASETPLDFAAALSGRQAVVGVAPRADSAHQQPFRADLIALLQRGVGSARDGLGGGGRPWQSGPLAVQRRVTIALPPGAVDGVTSMRLVADVAVRADGTLWVDAWLRNDIAMKAGGGTARYVARVLLDGTEALAFSPARHFQYTGIGRLLAASPGGRPAPPPPVVRPNALYLAEAGAVPPYDLTTGVDPSVFQRMNEVRSAQPWNEPFNNRGITRNMGMGGGRPDIGPMTDWNAAWLITGEPLAAAFCVGQAEAGGGIPWHMWDSEGGADSRGGWLNVRRWPGIWTDARGGNPPGGLAQQISGDTGWGYTPSHQPDLGTFPYMMTGRRALLDETLAQAMWNIACLWPAVRTPPGVTDPRWRDVILAHRQQVRGMAWSLRQLDNGAWVMPDDDPDAAYLREAIASNWAWMRSQIPAWTALQGEAHGWLSGEYGVRGALPPWQQDYLASTVAQAARRGSADARAVLRWMSNFLVGRFRAEDRGFPFNDGAAYLLAISPNEGTDNRPFRTWSEIAQATITRDWSNGDGWRHSNGDYARLAQQSLAQVVDVLDMPEARQSYARLIEARARYSAPLYFAQNPSQNIVPRGMQRITSRIRACTPAAPARG